MQFTTRPKPTAGLLGMVSDLFQPQQLSGTHNGNGDAVFTWTRRTPTQLYLVELQRGDTYLRIFQRAIVDGNTLTLTQAQLTALGITKEIVLTCNVYEYDPIRDAIGPGASTTVAEPAPTNLTAALQANGDTLLSWTSGDTDIAPAQQTFLVSIYNQLGTAVQRTYTITGQATCTYLANDRVADNAQAATAINYTVVELDANGNPVSAVATYTGNLTYPAAAPTSLAVARDDTNKQLVFTWQPGQAATGQEYYTVVLADDTGAVKATYTLGPGVTTLDYPYSTAATEFSAPPVNIHWWATQVSSQGVVVSAASAPNVYNYIGAAPPLNAAPNGITVVKQANNDILIQWQPGDLSTPYTQQHFQVELSEQTTGHVFRTDLVNGQVSYTYTVANQTADQYNMGTPILVTTITQLDASGHAISQPGTYTGVN